MGGKTVQFAFDDVSVDRVWGAALQAVAKLGYTILHSDSGSRVLSFNTGRSMSSWAGQDLGMTLFDDGQRTIMSMGGSLGKGGNPFGGGSQVFAWGEKGRLIDQFAATVQEIVPSIPETSRPASGAISVADELAKLASLRDSGALTDDEFGAQKARLLDDR